MKRILLIIVAFAPALMWGQRQMTLSYQGNGVQVYNIQPEGFVVVAGDEVLGFAEEGRFDAEDMPEAMKWLLRSYEEEVRSRDGACSVCTRGCEEDGARSVCTRGCEEDGARSVSPEQITEQIEAGNVVVGPLLKTAWAQTKYYNDSCPEDANGYGGHAMVGCGAVVMGQVMCYWQYPEHGKGSNSYYQSGYGTISADFEHTYYDYENMPKKLNSKSTAAQVSAVATLLYHCGVACNMYYGATSSSVNSNNIVSALTRYFRFKNTVKYIEKADYTTTQWHKILQEELDSLAPFFYGASGSYGGHVFVCDGYRDDDYYHLNWGWGGQYDGWFKISAFNPGPYDFNKNHAAIIGIRGDHLPSAVEDVVETRSATSSGIKVEKVIIDGRIYIIRDGVTYNIAGQVVKR